MYIVKVSVAAKVIGLATLAAGDDLIEVELMVPERSCGFETLFICFGALIEI